MPKRTLASTLRTARERAGLSQRALARRMDVSWVTVREAELGRNPRHSTLESYLDALPHLLPADMLSGARRLTRPDLDATWRWYRELFGFAARTISKDVVVRANGDAVTVHRVEGLRALRGSLADIALRTSLMRAICLGSSALVRSIEASPDDLTRRRRRFEDDDGVHEFTFPRTLARSGMSYTHRSVKRGLFSLAALAALESSRRRAFVHGTSIAVTHPVDRLALTVRFSGGRFPKGVRPYAWPATLVPEQDDADLLPLLGPGAVALRTSPTRRLVTIEVAKPLIELQYGLGWGER